MVLICESIKAVAKHHKTWTKDYDYVSSTNEFVHKSSNQASEDLPIQSWFEL
jgi:hypothetical protein